MASDATKQKINQSLIDLKNDVAKRTQSVVSGVTIPELDSTPLISPTDQLILETNDGTKRTTLKTFGDYVGQGLVYPQELIDARNDGVTNYPQLKDRLDAMDDKTKANEQVIKTNEQNIQSNTQAIQGNKQEIADLTTKHSALYQEVVDARTDNKNPNKTHDNLKERLDSDYKELSDEIEETNTQLSDANTKIDSQCVYLIMYEHLVSGNDWTDAIEKAIEDTAISPSRKLFIHSGTFEVSRQIRLPNTPISIVGINKATTTIKAIAKYDNMFYKDSELVVGTKFQNLQFDCNYNVNFMYINRLKEFEMVDCLVYRFKEYAIDINYTGSVPGAINYGYKFKNNQFRGCFDGEPRMVVPKYCVRLRGGCSDNVFENNTFVNASDCFIEDYSGGNDRIINNHFFSYPAPTYSPQAFIKSRQAIIIDNNYFDSPTLGILHQGDDFAIRNNFFYWSRADFGKYSAKGIKVTKNTTHNCRNFIIANNKFDFGANVTLTHDVEIDDYYTQLAYISGNVSNAQNQINNYYEKKIFDRNNRELLFQIFSNGSVYLTRRELNGSDKNVIQLEDNEIRFRNGNTTVQIKNGYITINNFPVTPLAKGSGSPMNNVTPIQQGQLYLDTSANAFYISYGINNYQWIKITQ